VNQLMNSTTTVWETHSYNV